MRKDPAGRRAIEQSVGLAFRFLFIGVGVLALAWLASGFVSVEPGSRAVVLRFGKIDRISTTGLVWAWPRPVEEVVVLPGPERQLTHQINALTLATRPEGQPLWTALDLREGGYALSGDGGAVHVGGVVTYHVSDVATYLLARERLLPALERTFCASAIAALAGRPLDGVLATRSATDTGGAAAVSAAQRDGLRGDIRAQMNQRLKSLGMGIEISRVDLTAQLPSRAKPAFDLVLAAEAEAARVVAAARTSAEQYRQQGEHDTVEIRQGAEAKAKERLSEARVVTDRITALAEESATPERRALMLTRIYRDRMEEILRDVTPVTLVDGREPVRLIISGGAERK